VSRAQVSEDAVEQAEQLTPTRPNAGDARWRLSSSRDWSDAEIVRAVTSGIARDGRTMHWQAMPWDHFSHLSPKDLVALVTYLRHLPPVRSEVPAPLPPEAADGEGASFGFGYDGIHLP